MITWLRQGSATLPETLDVCIAAFEAIRQAARRSDMAEPDLFAAFTSTAGAAADALEALATCPVAVQQSTAPPPEITGDPGDIADALADLAAALADRLERACAQAADDETRTACQDAARSARQIRDLMARADGSHAR